jgi:hypothetical protein
LAGETADLNGKMTTILLTLFVRQQIDFFALSLEFAKGN